MVSSEKKVANVIGGKTARACDSCIRKRARWYCAADDAFLCQFCDALVHSANPLARTHERVRLKISSLKLSSLDIPPPTWHQGFTKKSRTPRSKKHVSHQTPKSSKQINPLHLVPEIGSDELSPTNSDDQLITYQVPVLDPFPIELCFSGEFEQTKTSTSNDADDHYNILANLEEEAQAPLQFDNLSGLILPSDLELAEFAADVENLLGNSLDEECFNIDDLGMVDCKLNNIVKIEEEMIMRQQPFQLKFDYDSSKHEKVMKNEDEKRDVNIHDKKCIKKLRLDYDGIISAWDDDRSPWTTGDRPELDPNDCSLDCMGECGKMEHYYGEDMRMMMGNTARLDGGREARVSRYREKRRTRLFSKKIRYEVRKLNAERRPRMKGRFVKRASFAV
ncbi:zinc finger protein CONSTANS-LIKE 16-like [Rutidosis leptorrhynchoides]|uniref:zinc finger protein CONSTANS-LIKE 16-like n=1 Tax=Rutidosis leptorrhynchoides TaxID=125765 RepID=UPI003A99298F